MDKQQVQIVQQKVNKALQLSEEIQITSAIELTNAIDLLKRIKETGKIVKTQKEKITKPLLQAIKEARNMFKPIEETYTQAEQIVKDKILVYNQEQEKIKQEKEKELAEKIQKGEMRMEEATQELEQADEQINEGLIGKISKRKIKEVVITDETKIPRKYLSPNMSLIRQDLLTGVKIDGVEVREKEVIVSR